MKSIAWGLVVALVLATISAMTAVLTAQSPAATHHATIQQYCATCHNARLKTGGLSLDAVDLAKVSRDAAVWDSAMHLASSTNQGSPSIIRFLVQHGANLNITNKAGRTQLDAAMRARDKNDETIALLKSLGAELSQAAR